MANAWTRLVTAGSFAPAAIVSRTLSPADSPWQCDDSGVGTLIAALVTTQLPAGTWSSALVASFFHGERITHGILAVVVGLIAAAGALTLTDSHSTEEHVQDD